MLPSAKRKEIAPRRREDAIDGSIYATASGQRLIVLRTFVKKTEKTPPRELLIALARLKEVEE